MHSYSAHAFSPSTTHNGFVLFLKIQSYKLKYCPDGLLWGTIQKSSHRTPELEYASILSLSLSQCKAHFAHLLNQISVEFNLCVTRL